MIRSEEINLLWKYNKVFKWRYAIIVLLASITTSTSYIIPKLIQNIIDNAIPNKDINLIFKIAISIVLITIFSEMLNFMKSHINISITEKVKMNLKEKVINIFKCMDGEYYSNINTGEFMVLLEQDANNVGEMINKDLIEVLVNIAISIVAFCMIIRYNILLVIICVAIQFTLLIGQYFFDKKVKLINNDLREIVGKKFSNNQQYIANIMQFKLINADNYFISKFKIFQQNNYLLMLKLNKCSCAYGSFVNLIITLLNVVIYAYGGYLVILGQLSIGELILLTMYVGKIVQPFSQLLQVSFKIQSNLVSLRKIIDMINLEKEKEKGLKCNSIDAEKLTVRFQNIKFSYKDNIVLNNLNLNIKPNFITALVGRSGAGKTTIIKLLFRLWKESGGNIFINDQDIEGFDVDFIRSQIAIVSQECFIFNDTIKKNILLDKTVDENSLREVIELSQLTEVIESLPEGIETHVGEYGVRLSGGQRQRVAIARAMISDARIVIFDEATSSLDNITEIIIKKAIEKLSKTKTIIVIAHRLSTIVDTDGIYVLENGKVIEHGTFTELMMVDGEFKKMYLSDIKSS